jgi:hypothetical protein
MSWDEVRTRLGQEVGKRADYALYRAGVSRAHDGIGTRVGKGARFFFSPEQVQERVALLKKHLPEEVERTLQEADEILQHLFRLLGYRDLDYGGEIDWHLDPVHGKRAPIKPWYKIPFLDFEQVGDHKIIWELNRHQHLVTLTKAWAFTGADKYARELANQFYSWRTANPYPMGINWGSSLEVAFRSLSWIWVRNLLGRGRSLPDALPGDSDRDLDRDLLRGLALNGRYIERYLSTYFSPNTHLIGEAVALFFIGTLCPEIPAAAGWQRKGLHIVLAEAERQVRPDGVYFEQSLYYHVYALDFFLHTRALAACNGIAMSESFDAILSRMLEVVRVLTCNGPPEGFGDDDGGRVFNPRRNRAEHISDPLAVGGALLRRDPIKQAATLTEEAIWLFGENAAGLQHAGSLQTNASPSSLSSLAFAQGGLYVMASDEASAQMLIDAGPQGNGTSGHGHADALSVSLWTKQRRWLVDPGSYVYVSAGDERSQFRGTGAHNTLRVDGLDQAVPVNPFSWTSLPDVSGERWLAGSIFTFFSGSHTGYRRLPDPVLHRRMIFYLRGHLHGEYWLVRDIAEGVGVHDLEIFWHFGPNVNVGVAQSAVTVHSASGDSEKLVLLGANPRKWELAVAEGFVSPVYGEKESSLVASFGARIQLPAEHATLVLPLGVADMPGRFRLVDEAREAIGYVYQQGEVMDYIIFASGGGTGGKPWSVGPFYSDAAVLFCRMENREITALAVCSATKVQLDGREVFLSSQQVERLEWTRAAGASASDPQSLKFFSSEALRRGTPVL